MVFVFSLSPLAFSIILAGLASVRGGGIDGRAIVLIMYVISVLNDKSLDNHPLVRHIYSSVFLLCFIPEHYV